MLSMSIDNISYTMEWEWTMTYIQREQLISHEAFGLMGYDLLSLDICHRHLSGKNRNDPHIPIQNVITVHWNRGV